MTREEMKEQLEKLEEARKNYFYEYQITKECLEEISPRIKLFLTIGSLDGRFAGSVDEEMASIESEMKRYGVEWNEERGVEL